MKKIKILFCIITALTLFSCSKPKTTAPLTMIEQLGITTNNTDNREFSFTDKQSAYWYGRAHSKGQDWFSGWNVATQKIFQDYNLYIDGKLVARESAVVTVFPHKIVRQYSWGEETFRMFDQQRVLMIELQLTNKASVAIELLGSNIAAPKIDDKTALYPLKEQPTMKMGVSTLTPSKLTIQTENAATLISGDSSTTGFFIALADSDTEKSDEKVTELLQLAQKNHPEWIAARETRMEKLLADNSLTSNNTLNDKAIRWNILSLDSLITQQTGDGIYAGLPWFNDYWGRDMFISLPGATLVTGEHEIARKILLSFAKYQNTDEKSIFFGRVPNRVRPDDIIYNTTDGTPRFIIALFEYIRYSGDTSLIKELYPVVQRSIEGPLQYWVDEKGYLTHDEADTWMDAKWEGVIPWSPRGNRANDIQALWLNQLHAGIYFANEMKDAETAAKWQKTLEKLQANFLQDFVDNKQNIMADRLLKDGTPDTSFRPNQLFALDFVQDQIQKNQLKKSVWQELVYPWGVASLSQRDPNFHPWHEWDTYIHKDEAYHNGTVWLWNNGIAMQRMIEAGNKNLAFELFNNMSNQTVNSAGAVGALSELTDALPRPDKNWAKLSGTFAQAWSSAEYLRVWYQYFLGIQPNAINQTLTLSPNIPDNLTDLSFHNRLFSGHLTGTYHRQDLEHKYTYTLGELDFAPTIKFKLPTYSEVSLPINSGETLSVISSTDSMQVTVIDNKGATRFSSKFKPDPKELAKVEAQQKIMAGTHFAKPILNNALPALQSDNKEKMKTKLDAEMKNAKH